MMFTGICCKIRPKNFHFQTKYPRHYIYKKNHQLLARGWLRQLSTRFFFFFFKHQILDSSAGHDLRIVRSSPALGSVLGVEFAGGSLSSSASCSAHTHTLSVSNK